MFSLPHLHQEGGTTSVITATVWRRLRYSQNHLGGFAWPSQYGLFLISYYYHHQTSNLPQCASLLSCWLLSALDYLPTSPLQLLQHANKHMPQWQHKWAAVRSPPFNAKMKVVSISYALHDLHLCSCLILMQVNILDLSSYTCDCGHLWAAKIFKIPLLIILLWV